MRWLNSTHRPPRCGVCNSHLRLRLRIRRSTFWFTKTLDLVVAGVTLSFPPSPGPLQKRAFLCPHTRCGALALIGTHPCRCEKKEGPPRPHLLNALPPSSGSTHILMSRYIKPLLFLLSPGLPSDMQDGCFVSWGLSLSFPRSSV